MPTGYPHANTSPCWTRWGVGTKCDELPSFYIWLLRFFYKSIKRTRNNDDLDSYSDNEPFVTGDTWPRFIVMTSASEEKPLIKLSPFAVQKGFQAIAGTLKSTKRLRDGSFLVECSRRAQVENLLRTTFVDRPVHISMHKTEFLPRCDQML